MSVAPTVPDVASIAGPVVIGFLFNWSLYGSLSVQVYLYYLAFPKDRLLVKCLVYGLYAIETTQTILVMHDAFKAFGAGFGNFDMLNNVQTTWLSVPIISGIVSCSVQIFFAYRLFVLSGSKIYSIIITLIALTEGSAAIVAGVQAFQTGNFADLQSVAFVSTGVWLSGSALCDIIIALLMIYFLSRSDTGYRPTSIMLKRLVKLTVETGALTATVATVDAILFLTFQHSNYHTVPALTLAKLYSNTTLAILNSRMQIVDGRDMLIGQDSSYWTDPSKSIGPHSIAVGTGKTQNGIARINITKNTWTDFQAGSIPLGTMETSNTVPQSSEIWTKSTWNMA